jgi:hypothetical protein
MWKVAFAEILHDDVFSIVTPLSKKKVSIPSRTQRSKIQHQTAHHDLLLRA